MMQGGDSFRLIVRRGPQPNQIYELTKEIVTIGRDITNDIVINDPEVSRHHMRLTRGAGGFTLEDLGSTNGTFINGQRLTGARPLRNGELVGLGETVTLSYEGYGAASAGTMPSAAAPVEQRYSPPPGVQPEPQSPYAPPPANSEYGTPPPGYVSFSPAGQQPPAQGAQIRYSTPPTPQLTPSGQPIYPGASGVPQAPPPGMQSAPNMPGQYPGSPNVPGFDSAYDPYAARDEAPRNTSRLILLGCGGLTLFCCCATGLGVFAVDQLCLWDRLPLINQIVGALGLVTTCAT
ncbi:MAG: FHA domain-containing protein [Chloroflexota bacterium]|nr:FHA domain-containing protein [Chloroflexota bacterium]